MDHPITSKMRLAGPVSRLYRKYFKADDPRGWADYHLVPERRGTLWIHCHGLQRQLGSELELVAVPPELRAVALDLMFAVIRHFRGSRSAAADMTLKARLVPGTHNFAHLATLRAAPRADRRHQGSLRILDHGEPIQSGVPRRLFATHLAAQAEVAEDPKRKEKLYRRALEIFPGDFGGDEGTEFDPNAPDLTMQQNRSNLAAYMGLAEILRAQRRMGEAAGYLEAAIARCPRWAMAHRMQLLQDYRPDDPYLRYWQDANIGEIAVRRQTEEMRTRTPPPTPAAGHRPSFGRRPRGVADFL